MKPGMLLGIASTALVWLTGYSGVVFCIGLLVAFLQSGTPLELWKIGLLLLSSLFLALGSAGMVTMAIVSAYRIRRKTAEDGAAT
jgi:hypothetical protein